MSSTTSKAAGGPVFDLSGGMLCLDFANTTRHRTPDREDLPSYADLVAWSRASGSVTEADARSMRREAARRPREAEAALGRARALRAAIYATFSDIAVGKSPLPRDVAAINDSAVSAWRNSRLVSAGKGYTWTLDPEAGELLDRPLFAVARSAAELLTSNDLLPCVRECALDTCAWLFLDRSKNQKRRWCDMKICGNRSKARRHYARNREGQDPGRRSPARRKP